MDCVTTPKEPDEKTRPSPPMKDSKVSDVTDSISHVGTRGSLGLKQDRLWKVMLNRFLKQKKKLLAYLQLLNRRTAFVGWDSVTASKIIFSPSEAVTCSVSSWIGDDSVSFSTSI